MVRSGKSQISEFTNRTLNGRQSGKYQWNNQASCGYLKLQHMTCLLRAHIPAHSPLPPRPHLGRPHSLAAFGEIKPNYWPVEGGSIWIGAQLLPTIQAVYWHWFAVFKLTQKIKHFPVCVGPGFHDRTCSIFSSFKLFLTLRHHSR